MQIDSSEASNKTSDSRSLQSPQPSIQHGDSSQEPATLLHPLHEEHGRVRLDDERAVQLGEESGSIREAGLSSLQLVTDISSPTDESVLSQLLDVNLPKIIRQTQSVAEGNNVSLLLQMPEEVVFHIISHLPASDLLTIKLVCRRLQNVVDTPHAWIHAFSGYFPGPGALRKPGETSTSSRSDAEIKTEKRSFTRLVSVPTWTSEYLVRTRLLRCIARGRPAIPFAAPGKPHKGYATMTYNSRLIPGIDCMDATFGPVLSKNLPHFVHGWRSIGTVTASDKRGKLDGWGITQRFGTLRTFEEAYPGHLPWGLGSGDLIGLPNVMDLSSSFGMVYGEGYPGGHLFFLASDRKVLHWLPVSMTEGAVLPAGIPRIASDMETICAVWIAKTPAVPRVTNGLVGILCGSSSGTVSAYSVGGSRDQRFAKGELTARWLLSPGVPIVALKADDQFSDYRESTKRVWAVALNALGELFYLLDVPHRADLRASPDETAADYLERLAWMNGLTAKWGIVKQTIREVRPSLKPSYTPSFYYSEGVVSENAFEDLSELGKQRQLQQCLEKQPISFRSEFLHWDMQRKFEVDFAGDDEGLAGENIVIFKNGQDEGEHGTVTRFRRRLDAVNSDSVSHHTRKCHWLQSNLLFNSQRSPKITATALDLSTFAVLTSQEDSQSLQRNTKRRNHGSTSTELKQIAQLGIPGQRARFVAAGTDNGVVYLWNVRNITTAMNEIISDVHPIRIIRTESPAISSLALTALYLVHGGSEGLVQAWDVLASTTDPIRTLSSRNTLNARRRAVIAQQNQLGQSNAYNYAAGAICLDPDPSILRGIVAIGSWLRYWHYSSETVAEDSVKSRKRKTNRDLKGLSSSPGDTPSSSRRYDLKSFVSDEMAERTFDQKIRVNEQKEENRIAARFGLNLLGNDASEEEMVAYATMLSEEDHERRQSLTNKDRLSEDFNATDLAAYIQGLSEEDYERWQYASWKDRFEISTPVNSSSRLSPYSTPSKAGESSDSDADLAQAMKLSLDETVNSPSASRLMGFGNEGFDEDEIAIAVMQSTARSHRNTPTSPPVAHSRQTPSPVRDDDLEEAINRSLEEQSPHSPLPRRSSEQSSFENDFPALGSSPNSPSGERSWVVGKGKGRAT